MADPADIAPAKAGAEPDAVEKGIELIRQLMWCKAQLSLMHRNLELAQKKSHQILARLEDEGVYPIRRPKMQGAFATAIADIDAIQQALDVTLDRAIDQMAKAARRCGAG